MITIPQLNCRKYDGRMPHMILVYDFSPHESLRSSMVEHLVGVWKVMSWIPFCLFVVVPWLWRAEYLHLFIYIIGLAPD